MVAGQTSVAHGVGDTEPAEDLHRARADVVSPHTLSLAGGPHLGNPRGDDD
jgi:hypothetical protein